MAKPLIVIVDKDEGHLTPLEMKIIETLRDNAEIEIISDESYFEEYFTKPRTIDILVIDDSFYSEALHMHNIDKTYVLTEDFDKQDEAINSSREAAYLYKYCKQSVLLDRIIPSEWGGSLAKNNKAPQIITVVSPAGGTGSTTIAMGICSCMKQNLKRVLYLNTENYQNFHYYLKNKTTLPIEACTELQKKDGSTYEKIKQYLLKEEFVYLPPLKSAKDSLGVLDSAYSNIARGAKLSNDFDFIVVDVGNGLSNDMLHFLSYVDKVFVVLNQNAHTAFKLGTFKRNVNCDDTDKFIMVCNNYEKEKANALVSDEYNFVVDAYVEKKEELLRNGCVGMREMEDMQKLAYMLI